ncbi:Polyisoprenoid-binding protein YceI [Pseudovibrio ascidiaceicola]|uniref:Polyisoprenoid-binding protein YceI n=1 Tax=Pseudovibrio ascidiaceicola TaxID=285279 RepID=A0A1I4BDV9_9HYPH|nr:YceI family protein [Pseudovibrio ascidiaceicola]SFK66480.1 Polyisoprenoid-binding protein YceI [Pseudovibrio ascidiaceicola]
MKRLTDMFFKAGVFLTFILVGAASSAFANEWSVDRNKSTLGFEVINNGNTVTGTFATWNAKIIFNKEELDKAQIQATIITGSVKTEDAQAAGAITTPQWLDISSFPDAVFRVDNVVPAGGDLYEAAGTLELKGAKIAVFLPFTLTIEGKTAHAVGEATLSRSDFKIGDGVPDSTVSNKVTVKLDLYATR